MSMSIVLVQALLKKFYECEKRNNVLFHRLRYSSNYTEAAKSKWTMRTPKSKKRVPQSNAHLPYTSYIFFLIDGDGVQPWSVQDDGGTWLKSRWVHGTDSFIKPFQKWIFGTFFHNDISDEIFQMFQFGPGFKNHVLQSSIFRRLIGLVKRININVCWDRVLACIKWLQERRLAVSVFTQQPVSSTVVQF